MPILLAVIPHPDDESYSFGGTIALAARAGWRCVVHCATDGEGGERHDGGPAGAVAVGRARRAELAASCSALGAEAPVFWGLPDGGLPAAASEVARLRGIFADLQPDLVLALGADGAYGHPDHLAVHRWVADARAGTGGGAPAVLYAAFPRGVFRVQYEKCVASGIMGDPPMLSAAEVGTGAWDYEVPIGTVAEVKLRAIAMHHTQLPGGDPDALFPPGIVATLLGTERFSDATGHARPEVAALLARLAEGGVAA